MKFFYDKFYKKLIIIIIILFFGLKYYDQIPYPLILEEKKVVEFDDRLKELPNACFKVDEIMS